jgi:hypothetical protein
VTFLNRLNALVKKRGRAAAFWGDAIIRDDTVAVAGLDKDLVPWVWGGGDPKNFIAHGNPVWNSRGWWIPDVVPFADRRGSARYSTMPREDPEGIVGENATSWGDKSPAGYYLFEVYSLSAWLDGLWSSKGGRAESFDKAFALQVLGMNDPEAARLLRDAPYRIKDAGGLLAAAISAKSGLADLTANTEKRKQAIQELRGKWKDADRDIEALAALEKRVPDPRARIYVYCVQGQARQLQQAARLWDHLAQASELYAKARVAADPASRKKSLDEARGLVDALLPFYEFLADFHTRCIAETGIRPDHADVRVRKPFKTRDDLKALSAKLADLAAGGDLPGSDTLGLFPQ